MRIKSWPFFLSTVNERKEYTQACWVTVLRGNWSEVLRMCNKYSPKGKNIRPYLFAPFIICMYLYRVAKKLPYPYLIYHVDLHVHAVCRGTPWRHKCFGTCHTEHGGASGCFKHNSAHTDPLDVQWLSPHGKLSRGTVTSRPLCMSAISITLFTAVSLWFSVLWIVPLMSQERCYCLALEQDRHFLVP
jgi:hypothetical protein